MAKFEPSVAFRILAEKQLRFYDRQWELIREKTELWLSGDLIDSTRVWYEDEIRANEKAGDSMYDVLEYLRNRIEEGR